MEDLLWFTVRGDHNIVNPKAENEQEVGLGYKALTTLHRFSSFSKVPPPKSAATSPDSIISWGTVIKHVSLVGAFYIQTTPALYFYFLLNRTVSLFLPNTHRHRQEQCDNIRENALETIGITFHNHRSSQLPFCSF